MKSSCLFLASLVASASAFAPSAPVARTTTTTTLSAQVTRSQVLTDIGTAFAAVAVSSVLPLTANADEVTPSGISIKVIKSGNGPAPDIGELAAIRFASSYGDMKIDNVFDTAEPYYTRIGSGGLIKGVEEVLPKMRLGDRWVLTIPGNLAFGAKGKPASPGTPRIPANAEITFDVEMVGLPGKEPELIDIIGD